MSAKQKVIKVRKIPSVQVNHNKQYPIYTCAIDAKELREQVNIDRMRIDEKTGEIVGYQRQIDERHCRDIMTYLKDGMASTGALMTDAVTIALKEEVIDSSGKVYKPKFTSSDPEDRLVRVGVLELPFLYYKEGGRLKGIKDDEESLGWVVDGQHRLEAFWRHAYPSGKFPIPASMLITSDKSFQQELFLRTNLRLPVNRKIFLRDLGMICARVSRKYAMDQLCMRIVAELEKMPPFKDKVERL